MLLKGNVDLAQLSGDCSQHLVQDVPQLNLSLPLVETYLHLIQLSQTNSKHRMTSPLERILDLSDGCDGFGPLRAHYKIFRAVNKYNLDQLPGRRLSPKVAEKYPFLGLEYIVTDLPVASFEKSNVEIGASYGDNSFGWKA